jgi:hypothetical protein
VPKVAKNLSPAIARLCVALRTATRVAFDRLVQVDSLLIRQRRHPGDHVTEFVELLSSGSLANGLGQFADFLGQPRNRRSNTTVAIAVTVRALDHVLQLGKVHGARVDVPIGPTGTHD